MSNTKSLPDKTKRFSDWYQEVVAGAELAEHAAVKGCMVIRPYGFAVWERIQSELDPLLKERGTENAYFPSLIPESYLAREKKHVEGFSPECAVVTAAGGAQLAEPLVVRPTSETVIHASMARWIQSYRDLPMRLNQWVNVVRWERRPRLFLRNTEFLWQEGHTAHASEQEAREEALSMASLYEKFSRDVLAIPVVNGTKSPSERFAGAIDSYSIEGLMPDGKGLQMGTAHYLGDSFSKVADMKFLNSSGVTQNPHMTSWGVSTRLIGAIVMVHGDEKGLVLPPRIAPIQVVVVPIGSMAEDQALAEYVQCVKSDLQGRGIRVKVDSRDGLRPGAKFYHWEIRGVPLRIEIGKRDMDANSMTLVWRKHLPKVSLPLNGIHAVPTELVRYQTALLDAAERDVLSRMVKPDTKEAALDALSSQAGFVRIRWCGDAACETEVREKTTATFRNLPRDDQGLDVPSCTICGKPARSVVYAAKAY